VIIDQEKRHQYTFWGAVNTYLAFDGNKIISPWGNPEPPAKAFSTEDGQLSLPLNDPTVQTVIAFVKALDHKPTQSNS
jgi:hypothetical protein